MADCGRWSDLPGGPTPIDGMPFATRLLRESVSFPKAVAPSPWTPPSHASLFTGLYPWEHRAHLKHSLFLNPAVPTLAKTLDTSGYASFSASSNGFISPELGLVNGFQSAAWGEWWEKYLHLPSRTAPPRALNYAPTQQVPSGGIWDQLDAPARILNRFPSIQAILNRFVTRMSEPGRPFSPEVSSWIEPTIRAWLTRQPRETPVFCFVNYFEGHEPYLIEPEEVGEGFRWSDLLGLRMDWTNFLAGRWIPTEAEFRLLRQLYRASVRTIDRRLRRLVEVFQEAGRWENTLFIFTSDHGQAFGERGYLFHSSRLWESVVRIPLWVRYPSGEGAGSRAQGWASLVDVAPTIWEATGATAAPSPSAVSLQSLIDDGRASPVLTISDGSPAARRALRHMAPPAVVEFWDQPLVAAYDGDKKIILSSRPDRVEAYDVVHDAGENRDVWNEYSPVPTALLTSMRSALDALTSAPAAAPQPEVDRRLRSWGYD